MGFLMSKDELSKLYNSKKMTPDEAAKLVESNMVCGSDIALGQSYLFYQAVAKRIKEGSLKNVTQHSLLDVGNAEFYQEEYYKEYHGVSWFSSGYGRKAVNAGLCDIMPCHYRDIPGLFVDYIKPDIYVGVVSSMDSHGYFSTGTDGSISEGLLKSAKIKILEVNPNMPRALSAPQIHISEVAALWENDTPLFTLPVREIDDVSKKIGDLIAERIPDGATLQLGIGAIPDAVGLALKSKKHLGIHTEMLTDSMVELVDCGAVDNSLKPIHTGKTVAAFAMGSQKMYDFINDNPGVAMLPVDHTNDPYVIAQHDNFVSINAAVEVDFLGQVCAESIGSKHVSGTGGHNDFTRGAVQSKGGMSFIAFTASTKGQSKIVPTLSPGASVSSHKNDVDHIVTEYGVAKLRGQSLAQRAKALIGIAAPEFREELTAAAKKMGILI